MDSPARRFSVRSFVLAGFVALALPAGAAAATPEYPDLIADPVERPQVAISDGKQLLRFDGFVHNSGPGVLELTGESLVGLELDDVTQQIYNDDGTDGPSVASAGQMIFENDDSHNHFHLKQIARYSLWNAAKTEQVAEPQKVGFCLVDSQRVSADNGPVIPEYSSSSNFCHQGSPPSDAALTMGITNGWRDIYTRGLAFQWVDISNVAPGQYWIKAEIDPLNYVDEGDVADEDNAPAYPASMSVVPGYLASPVGPVGVNQGTGSTVALDSDGFGGGLGSVQYKITDPPDHGSLNKRTGYWFNADEVVYTPEDDYTGADQFKYVARDAAHPTFPTSPPAAAAMLNVGGVPPGGSVAVSGAPAQLFTGATAQLSALVSGAPPGVTWSVDGVPGGDAESGTISSTGFYTAPASVPPWGDAKIRATASTGAYDEVTIALAQAPPPEPQPSVEIPQPQPSAPGQPLPALSRAKVFRRAGRVYVSIMPQRNGRLIVKGKAARKSFRICSVRTRAKQQVTCRVKVPRSLKRRRVAITAKLVLGSQTLATRRAALRPLRKSSAAHTHSHYR